MSGGNENQKEAAIKRCALKPVLYRKLWDDYAEHRALPGDDTLRSLLITDYDFNPKSVDKAISGFRETIEFAEITYDDTGKSDESNGTDDKGKDIPDRGSDFLGVISTYYKTYSEIGSD